MPSPRVFVSSTFYDLRYLRASLEDFVRSFGFEPVLFERGTIAYEAQAPLDHSAYREVESCQLLVLIIGGRYGSESRRTAGFSITMDEYRTAIESGIPAYAFIESSVRTEYRTYLENRGVRDVRYAHVESIEVFEFLQYISSQARNNFMFSFSEPREILDVLRQQWAGLFYEYLVRAKEQPRIKAIQETVDDLRHAVERLEAYAERLVRDVADPGSIAFITEQRRARQQRLLLRALEDFQTSTMGRFVGRFTTFDDADEWARVVLSASSIREFLNSCSVPATEIEYVASRELAADAFQSLQRQVEGINRDQEAESGSAEE